MIEKKLLFNQDIAIVTLNLPDLLELTVVQAHMPKELHDKIHACINHAYEVLHHSPEVISPELSGLKDKPIFLSGMSFGGRTAAMHEAFILILLMVIYQLMEQFQTKCLSKVICQI